MSFSTEVATPDSILWRFVFKRFQNKRPIAAITVNLCQSPLRACTNAARRQQPVTFANADIEKYSKHRRYVPSGSAERIGTSETGQESVCPPLRVRRSSTRSKIDQLTAKQREESRSHARNRSSPQQRGKCGRGSPRCRTLPRGPQNRFSVSSEISEMNALKSVILRI